MSQKFVEFQKTVWDYYNRYARDLPWRHTDDPYKILISEIMLQQTQAARVIPKYEAFVKQFPTARTVAKAPLAEVLKAWSGLGYNRRAKFLHEAAKVVDKQLGGKFPKTIEQLTLLPGIGKNTAGAILAYAFNIPVIFIETNIRTVYIHHFFTDKADVADSELIPIIEQTLDTTNSREWYWALMDYGVFIKSTVGNRSRSSKHYAKQSKFEGSKRQVRGRVLKMLATQPQTEQQLMESVADIRLPEVLDDLIKEKMISRNRQTYHLG